MSEPKEIRESFADDDDRWAPIRKARGSDVKALGPDSTWDDKDRKARAEAGRPCLAFDELSQYVNQLVNDARETKRAIEVNPGPGVDSGEPGKAEAVSAQARFVGALIRQIEERSNAQLAYTQMFDDAVSGSYGWVRVVPRYLERTVKTPSARSFDQELTIQPVPNPDLITPGYFVNPDLSDCERFWVHESFTHADFDRRFKGKRGRPLDVAGAMRELGPSWIDDKRIWVRELWELKSKPKTLLLLADGTAIWADEAPEGVEVARERVVDTPYLCQTITNGLDVLEKRDDLPGSYLPIIGCVGRMLWTDAERKILSLIRNALGPQQLYNYYRTSEAEIVGMTPKTAWFYYEGTLDPANETALTESNMRPVGAIKVKAAPNGWNPAHGPMPFPSRTPYEPPIQALEAGAESTRRGIQSATGTGFMPTEAQRHNQKSGVALREIATSALKGAYHFVDHFEHALRRVGVVLVDYIPHYYDTPRDVHVRGKDDRPMRVRINDPQTPAPSEYGGGPINLSAQQAEFDVTLSTGPSYATERDKASEFADQFVSARPETLSMFMDLIIKLKNLGPVGDKMAERAFSMLPPAIQQMEKGQQPMSPREQQMQMQIQQMQAALQQAQQIIQSDVAKEQAKGASAEKLKALEGQIKLALQQLVGDQKLEQLTVQAQLEAADREDTQRHESAMAGADAADAARQAEEAAYNAQKSALFGGGPGATSP